MGLLEHLYAKIFIAIIEDGERIDIATQVISGGKKDDDFQSFESLEELKSYIQDLLGESPYYYISLLNNCSDQGALPTCDKLKMRDFADVSLSVSLCMDKKWALYSSSGLLQALEKRHQSYGLDYIFSPFTILQHFFKDKIKEVLGLYVLIQNESLCIAVFSQEKLEFGMYVVTDADEIALTQNSLESSGGFEAGLDEVEDEIDFDDLSVLDDIEALDNIESLDDIETLDDMDSIESFEDFAEESDILSIEEPDASDEESIEGFNLDFYRFTLIQEALKKFYSDDAYESVFIEAVFIADAVGIGQDLKSYLEEELFVTPIVRKINLSKSLLELTKDEVAHAS